MDESPRERIIRLRDAIDRLADEQHKLRQELFALQKLCSHERTVTTTEEHLYVSPGQMKRVTRVHCEDCLKFISELKEFAPLPPDPPGPSPRPPQPLR